MFFIFISIIIMLTDLINDIRDNKIDINKLYDNIGDIRKLFGANDQLLPLDSIKQQKDYDDDILLIRMAILKLLANYVQKKIYYDKEFNDNLSNSEYHLIICDDDVKLKAFILYIVVYKLDCSIRVKQFKDKRKRCFTGIDYEFVEGKIALMQINLENHNANDMVNYIFILNPLELDNVKKNLLISEIMTNKNIFKIFHGADSLDIPYMFSEMFNNSKKIIKKFVKKYVDTRFICEFYRNTVRDVGKCSIYDALKYFKVVDDTKYDFLQKTHDLMGPVQDVEWDIHKLSSFHLKYAFYDVLYLPKLFNNIYKHAYQNTPDKYKFYKYFNMIARLVLLEKRNILNITEKIKENINYYNNNIVKKGNNMTLLQLYTNAIHNMKINSLNLDINDILGVNYFKGTLNILLKKVAYHIITNKYTIYINKKDIQNRKVLIKDLYNELAQNDFEKLEYMFQEIYIEMSKKL